MIVFFFFKDSQVELVSLTLSGIGGRQDYPGT
jgi:hypothetical protein